MIYFGSGSSSEFSEFRIRIQAKVPDPCGSGSDPGYLNIFGNCKQTHLKFNPKEESINYENLKRNNIFIYLLCHNLLDPDPFGSGSTTLVEPVLYQSVEGTGI